MSQPLDSVEPEDQAEADRIAESLALLGSGQELYWEWFDVIAERSAFQGPRQPLVLTPVTSHEYPAIAKSNRANDQTHDRVDPTVPAEGTGVTQATPPLEG